MLIKSADGAGYGAYQESAGVAEDIGAWVIAAAEHAKTEHEALGAQLKAIDAQLATCREQASCTGSTRTLPA